MLNAGIFVDTENVNRCGGWTMRYEVVRDFVAAQGGRVVRANAYMARDEEREKNDPVYAKKKTAYRATLRSFGFKLVLKPVKRFVNEDGETVTKANADLDLAIDALLQSRRLDYVVLVTGDGDFARLVVALQDAGCRVDVISFHNASRELRDVADNFVNGFVLPDLVPVEDGRRKRGHLVRMDEERYYGFVHCRSTLNLSDTPESIFLHGNDLEEGAFEAEEMARLVGQRHVIEFAIAEQPDGKKKAIEARRVRPE